MSNSQILATSNFSTNHGSVSQIGEKLHNGAEFQQFSRKNMSVRVPGKLSEIIPKSWCSPIQGTISNILFNYGTDLSLCFYTFQDIVSQIGEHWDFGMFSDSFPGTLTYLLFLENSWNSAPMCSFSPIQGTMS